MAVLATTFGLSACAYSYTDDRGRVHAIGLTAMTISPAPHDGLIAGDIITISAIGLVAGSNAQGGYASLGYSRQTTAELRDNVALMGNPLISLQRVWNTAPQSAQEKTP